MKIRPANFHKGIWFSVLGFLGCAVNSKFFLILFYMRLYLKSKIGEHNKLEGKKKFTKFEENLCEKEERALIL